MKATIYFLGLLAAGSLAGHEARAQSVGIGTTAPDAKAALEIKASDKGLLIPRLTAAQRTAIASPPQGLMVYQTTAPEGFYYYGGAPGAWVYLNPSGAAGLSLPYAGSASSSATVFDITNSGGGNGLSGTASGLTGAGVSGINSNATSGSGVGVLGQTVSGYGVRGVASGTNGYGVQGEATTAFGVRGTSQSGVGVQGVSSNTTAASTSYGVQGSSQDSAAVYGANSVSNGKVGAVQGVARAGSASVGVLGVTSSGYGVRGIASASGGYGVNGVATNSFGVIGQSTSGTGVYGSSQSSYGVQGASSSSYGIYGRTSAGNTGTAAGVWGDATSGGGVGVLGQTTTGYAVRGEATGGGYGVIGLANSGTGGIGVYGVAASGTNADAVNGVASSTGRAGYFNQNNATSTANALEVQNSSKGRTAYFNQSNTGSTANAVEIVTTGLNVNKAGLYITHPSPPGFGSNNYNRGLVVVDAGGNSILTANSDELTLAQQGSTPGVTLSPFGGAFYNLGNTASTPLMVSATAGNASNGAFSVYVGQGKAANFFGDVQVQGTLAKSGGSFKIDHPLDPENQYLYHSFVESPDMMNVYNGNVTLDAQGKATVQLPDWFEALNRDFRYQLTPIGAAFTPYVLAEVAGNRFRIAGQPGGKVSWQVTGIRHDKWADANRIPVAEQKEPENRGKYLAPAAYGRPASQGIGYHSKAEAARR